MKLLPTYTPIRAWTESKNGYPKGRAVIRRQWLWFERDREMWDIPADGDYPHATCVITGRRHIGGLWGRACKRAMNMVNAGVFDRKTGERQPTHLEATP